MPDGQSSTKVRVVIAGGGVAGLEALLGLRALAADLVDITLVAPTADFVYKPMLVDEPFGGSAERRALAPIAEETGARFVKDSLEGVEPAEHRVKLGSGEHLDYDALLVAVGGRFDEVYSRAVTFRPGGDRAEFTRAMSGIEAGERVAFLVPPGVSWSLPLYELALMTQRRAQSDGIRDAQFTLVTPEPQPLALFGPEASAAVATLLNARGIECLTDTFAHQDGERLILTPGDRTLEADRVIALPTISGPRIAGLPNDADGFTAIDENCRVRETDGVYAAGDGTTFPIKQGGLATQQADAIVEQIAASAGASVEPQPFRPVLRGKLLTGDDSLYAEYDVAGGGGQGATSKDYLWWPPHKIGGRYLPAYLGHEEPTDVELPERPIDVEVALPHDWHEQPMGWQS